MFSRIALLAIASMAILAAGSPTSAQSCTGGAIQCCDSVQQSNSGSPAMIKALVGQDVGNINGLIGMTCSPVTNGANATPCAKQQVCCTNNAFNGVVALGCTAINANA